MHNARNQQNEILHDHTLFVSSSGNKVRRSLGRKVERNLISCHILPLLLLALSFAPGGICAVDHDNGLTLGPSPLEGSVCGEDNHEMNPEVIAQCDPSASDASSSGCFDRVADVFGIKLWVTPDVPQWAFEYATNVFFEYLDNDEDGIADDPNLIEALTSEERGKDVAVTTCRGILSSQDEYRLKDSFLAISRTYGQECLECEGEFQRNIIEEFHHAIQIGLGQAYPEVFGDDPSSELWQASNEAYGNCEKVDLCAPNCEHYTCICEQDGEEYPCPEDASQYTSDEYGIQCRFNVGSCDGVYHYSDITHSDGGVPTGEIYYFAFTSWLGWQSNSCEDLASEWSLCTPEAFENSVQGSSLYELVTGASASKAEYGYVQPSVLPDGIYTGVTPSPTSMPTNMDFNLCISGDSKVKVKGRGDILMKNLNLGDSIMSYDGTYDKVYTFGHYHPNVEATFLLIALSSGDEISLSSSHLLFLFDCSVRPVAAGSVKVGDELLLVNGTSSTVTSVISKRKQGVYAPFTSSGTLVVNNVVVSSFVELKLPFNMDSHKWSHRFEFFHRRFCSILSWWCQEERYDDKSGISQWALYSNSFFQLFNLYDLDLGHQE